MRWRCPNCKDEMDEKFKRTHALICAWLTKQHQRDLDTWIETWLQSP